MSLLLTKEATCPRCLSGSDSSHAHLFPSRARGTARWGFQPRNRRLDSFATLYFSSVYEKKEEHYLFNNHSPPFEQLLLCLNCQQIEFAG